jgi:CubicO group peptidase (beta-lactamase class C family)
VSVEPENRLDGVTEEAVDTGRVVGAVVLVAEDGAMTYRRAAGLADREARRPMEEDAIFRLASVSKPMVAATALALIERGALALDEPVTRWLPDFRPRLRDGTTPKITLRHLLTHTSGLGYGDLAPDDPYRPAGISGGLDQPGLGMAENLRRIASVPLYFAPGTAWRYGVNIDVLGAVIEQATGGRLGDAVAKFVTRPLGMTDTGFTVADQSRLATPYAEGVPPNAMGAACEVVGELGRGTFFVPDRIFDPASFHSGGAGMAGSAPDFMRFLEAIRTGGAPILKPETVDLAARNHIGDLAREEKDAGWRFGLISAVLADPAAAQTPQSPGTLQWGGIYGHSWFIDRARKLSVVAFTNTAVEGCLGEFPKEIVRAVCG